MKPITSILILVAIMIQAPLYAYPLDGTASTKIEHLEAQRQAQEKKRTLPAGALLHLEQSDLRLTDHPSLELPVSDAAFSQEVLSLVNRLSQGKADDFSFAVLDLSDINNPAYAEHRATTPFYPASVGKLGIAMGFFEALAQLHPEDPEARIQMLRETTVKADAFIRYDHHSVPLWLSDSSRLVSRQLQEGDKANLWTYLDWMLSASSNAAASMTLKQAMLMSEFGEAYPVDESQEQRFFNKTPKSELSALLTQILIDGIKASDLNPNQLYNGSFFTSYAKKKVPGKRSYATARELMRFLLHLEQGKVIDEFSSREIKRLLYVTKRRIRYADSPLLVNAAVYFKSGSYYRCASNVSKCPKYRGDTLNLLNSVAIIESPAGSRDSLYYMVVISSNILNQNAAVLHQGIATYIHRLIKQRHAVNR